MHLVVLILMLEQFQEKPMIIMVNKAIKIQKKNIFFNNNRIWWRSMLKKLTRKIKTWTFYLKTKEINYGINLIIKMVIQLCIQKKWLKLEINLKMIKMLNKWLINSWPCINLIMMADFLKMVIYKCKNRLVLC